MTNKARILAGVAAATLMALPAVAQTQDPQTNPPGAQPAQDGQLSGAIIRVVPGPAAGTDDPAAGADAEATGNDADGVTPEEAANAEPRLVSPADAGATAGTVGQGTGAATAGATGGSQPSTDAGAAIERADGPTTGVTDTEGVDPATGDADSLGFDFEGLDGEQEGGAGSGQMDMTFAREVFEQGYRQGYVAALTEMRMQAARGDRMRMRERDMRAQERQRPRGAGRVVVTEDAEGNTILMLPPGVNAQDFLRQMQRRSN